jgi:RNA polymerase sigma-70 factor, ECF subfamily
MGFDLKSLPSESNGEVSAGDGAVRPDPAARVMEALKRGDRRRAVTALIQHYGEALRIYCLRAMEGDRAAADDVYQTILLQAFEDIGSFSCQSSLRTWLWAIARHRALDTLRSARRRQARFVLQDSLPEEAAPERPTDDVMADGAVARIVESSVDALPSKVRTAVLLRYGQELTYEEMGRLLGEAPATLQARVSRALSRVGQSLRGEE